MINHQHLVDAMRIAIERELQVAVDRAADEAAEKARIAVREKLGSIATRLAREVDTEAMVDRLVITVRQE